ncbi:MAG: DUF2782 domain-containing protein [Gammaproteobacteria bacterium]|nr:DUF2782 domain-containing protein [Gammaproteobacteria bacterium]
MVLFVHVACAQNNEEFEEALPPPDLPDPIQSGQPIEPEVTIIQGEDRLIEEYRVNGNLYMVKVTPSIGPAYYLLDQDGDGKLESRTSRLGSDSTVPQWILFQW